MTNRQTVPATAFVSPSGRYYVTTSCGKRIECHNKATALYYSKKGVSICTGQQAS